MEIQILSVTGCLVVAGNRVNVLFRVKCLCEKRFNELSRKKKIELNHWLHLKRRIANEYSDDWTSAFRVNANLRPPFHSSGSSAALRCTQLTVLVGPLSYRSLLLITSFLGLPHLSCVGMLKLSAEHYFRHYFLLVCSM